MRSDSEKYQTYTRRAFLLGAGQLLVGTVLGARLYYLQVMKAKEYQVLADQNRIDVQVLPPPRGRIFDALGTVLADSQIIYRLFYTRDLDQTKKTLPQLQTLLNLPHEVVEDWLKRLKKYPKYQPFLLRDFLTWEEVALLSIHTPELPGLNIETGQSRLYACSPSSCHILGYVGLANDQEVTKDPMAAIPGFRIGKAGLEKVYDLTLRGQPGLRQVEVNARGRLIRELSQQESHPGEDLTLTILNPIQDKAIEALGDYNGCVVVVDCQTGAIRCMVSKPCYDPNLFIQGLSSATWKELSSSIDAPLKNRCITGLYSPGSTFKMVVALAGLKAGLIGQDDTVFCPGAFTLGSHTFRCWEHGGHGDVNLTRALQHSCDVYFYTLAQKLGIKRIAEMASLFGFGQPQGIDLPDEKGGIVPDEAWKKKTLKQVWYPGETVIAGIGQGYMISTPLQLAMMTTRLATGRTGLKPYLTKSNMPNMTEALPLTEQWLGLVRQGMYEVVNSPQGTANKSRLVHPMGEMAGKTGTVQVASLPQGVDVKKLQRERPDFLKDHAVFVGYAPYHDPKLAIAVMAEHGSSGSGAAAPVARDVMGAALDIYQKGLK